MAVMANTFNIPTAGVSELEFRLRLIAALDALADGSGLANNSIALGKLQQIATGKVLGNESGITANVSLITYP